jgi:putative acetyltransferase
VVGGAWLSVFRKRLRHVGALQFIMHPDYVRTDVASRMVEAALDLAENWLGLRRVQVTVFQDDADSIALYAQHGFSTEVTLRHYAVRAGELADAYLMARLSGLCQGHAASNTVAEPDPSDKASAPEPSDDQPLDIEIRGTEAADWEDVAEILTAPGVVYNTLQLPHQSRDNVRDRLEQRPENSYQLVATVDEQVIGQLGLFLETGRQAHVARLGMAVHPDFQGRGVGTALMEAGLDLAENWLNLTRIQLEVYPDNTAGVALYRRFGFEIEGVLRCWGYRAGQHTDTYLMARIRGENAHA